MPIQIIETLLKNIAHKIKHKLKNSVVNFRIYEHFNLLTLEYMSSPIKGKNFPNKHESIILICSESLCSALGIN